MENYALYSQLHDRLPEREMAGLATGVLPEIATTERGLTYRYSWPDLTVICSEMPTQVISGHLGGFVQYALRLSRPDSSRVRVERIVDRIRKTRLVVGVEVTPGRDADGRTESLIGKLCHGLRPIVFFENALYDWNMRLLLGPGGSFEEGAEIELSS